MPKSKHKRKNGRNKVTARSQKTHRRYLHKQHAIKRRERVYAQIREMQQKFNEEDQDAFDSALEQHAQ